MGLLESTNNYFLLKIYFIVAKNTVQRLPSCEIRKSHRTNYRGYSSMRQQLYSCVLVVLRSNPAG